MNVNEGEGLERFARDPSPAKRNGNATKGCGLPTCLHLLYARNLYDAMRACGYGLVLGESRYRPFQPTHDLCLRLHAYDAIDLPAAFHD